MLHNTYTMLALISHISPYCPVSQNERDVIDNAIRAGYVAHCKASPGFYVLTDMGKGYLNGFADRADLDY